MEKEIVVNSSIENLRIIEKFVDEISSEIKLNSESYGNVLIAILEASNNAIVHGNKLDENKLVKINAHFQNGVLIITVEDQGPGFNFNSIPDPTEPKNIENISGRGVFLMRKLSDSVEFRENGRIVDLRFKI